MERQLFSELKILGPISVSNVNSMINNFEVLDSMETILKSKQPFSRQKMKQVQCNKKLHTLGVNSVIPVFFC